MKRSGFLVLLRYTRPRPTETERSHWGGRTRRRGLGRRGARHGVEAPPASTARPEGTGRLQIHGHKPVRR
eukprot:758328-Hanusia_phi.AAC.1